MSDDVSTDLIAFRRDLHRHPEPGWREFYTTARIVEELETRKLDAIYVGPEVLAGERRALPPEDELDRWFEMAREAGAREDVLQRLDGGQTGAVAVLERGEGPTVALRVDIDALPVTESADETHRPAAEGFRSDREGYMHACGHDAHATIGLGVLDAIAASDFSGTLKVLFQPSEELAAGAQPMAESGHLDDVDYLLAVHVGIGHPTGEVVTGVDEFLAVHHFRADFSGAPAHAGMRPQEGRNAVLAMATAVQNLYAISRHADGATRINTGIVGGGTATNVVPETAHIEGEVRGGTTDLMEYMVERAETVLQSAATMHGCDVEVETVGQAPSAASDPELAAVVADAGERTAGVESILNREGLGGSEDATYLMQAVQENGGKAAYVVVGTDTPGDHHTSTFDVDEESIGIGVDLLAGAIRELSERQV